MHFTICFPSLVDKLVERGYAKVTVQVATLNMKNFSEHLAMTKQNVYVLLFEIRTNSLSITLSTKHGIVMQSETLNSSAATT